MYRNIIIGICMFPLGCLAQFTISGRLLNQADTKPVANASIFLSNTAVGNVTAANGTFTLYNVMPGKYDLVVSNIGFENYSQTIVVDNKNISLNDILLFPKTIALSEVKIRPHDDFDRQKYYELFKDEFLGKSYIAQECKILNPEVLDFSFDGANNTLTVTSNDFLIIENDALGYRIKYLLTYFSLQNEKTVFYKGPALFEGLKGSATEQSRWQKNRQEVYEGSQMHFFRALMHNNLYQEGFRVQQLSTFANIDRPGDSLINANIKFYKGLKAAGKAKHDSLSWWLKKYKLKKTFQKLQPFALTADEIVKLTDKPALLAFGCENDGLYVAYNKTHHYHISGRLEYLDNPNNTENTLISFNKPYTFFYKNTILANPFDVVFYGVWAKQRVAELLPVNYDLPQVAVPNVDSAVTKNIVAKYNTYITNRQIEQAYLHFDKPYYTAGDTMYFKAYVTSGEKHKLTNQSGVLHVDLINTYSNAEQSLNLQITDGVAWGDFALPDTLQGGTYRVRAYTRLMINNGTNNYFDQTIPIGTLHGNKIPEAVIPPPLIADRADIQFFAEGGSLVTGIRSKVAFKAIGSNGLGVNVTGEILDSEDKLVTTFTSAHLGMGYFYLTPAEGKIYKAKITYPDKSQHIVNIPAADTKGIVLSVNNDQEDRALITIAVSNAFYKQIKNKVYTLAIYSAGEASTIICKLDSQEMSFDILKSALHTGISTITLISPVGEPLSERLIFVKNNDQLNIGVGSDKKSYVRREKVSINLNAKNNMEGPVSGHFSASVIDESKVPMDENTENTILTDLLLTADLKGYVEQPNYYFTNITDKTNAGLDLVMLTHGYRRFEWKKLLNNEYPVAANNPETGLEISGMVKSPNGKPLTNGSVSLLSMNGGPVVGREIDENGAFRFTGLIFMDSTHFFLKATNEKLKINTIITYTAAKPVPVTDNTAPIADQGDSNKLMAVYLKNKKNQQEEIAKSDPIKGILLKQVNVKSTKPDDNYPSSNLGGPGHADQVIHRSEFPEGSLFSHRFNGLLLGVRFYLPPMSDRYELVLSAPQTLKGSLPMLLVVDGVKISQSDLNVDDINVDDIETIEVLRTESASIYGSLGGNGVLVITTRKGADGPQSTPTAQGILHIAPKGFYKAREFYSPKYRRPNDNLNQPDLRSTVYWKPEIVTDKDGNASFGFYNADGTGSYRVVIEGIDDSGNLGRQVYRYMVK